MNDDKPYILGTDNEEIKRLELQHKIWLSEAKTGWVSANFSKNDTILDLGSGPGTCSKELAKIVGTGGKIISVDKSSHYIQYIEDNLQNKYPQITPICTSFEDLNLKPNSIDHMFCRWSLAWEFHELLRNPRSGKDRLALALVRGPPRRADGNGRGYHGADPGPVCGGVLCPDAPRRGTQDIGPTEPVGGGGTHGALP